MTLQSVTICNLVVDFESVISKSRGGGGVINMQASCS